MKTKLTLLGARLHVAPIVCDRTAGGMFLPECATDACNTGGPKLYRVLGTGPGTRNRKGILTPVEAVPGDRVLVHSFTEGPTELGDGTLIVNGHTVIAMLPHL